MSDLRSWFQQAERIPVSDPWSDIVTREPGTPAAPSPWRRIAAGGIALALAAAGIVLVVRAFDRAAPARSTDRRGPGAHDAPWERSRTDGRGWKLGRSRKAGRYD
jgi:hypothetical protein